MDTRSPIELLGAIVDEVDGLRQSDKRSHLPESLLREARDAVGTATKIGAQLSSLHDLAGQTITHVFDCLLRGEWLFYCQDGSYIAIEVQGYSDDAEICTARDYGGKGIANFLAPSDLHQVGLMTAEQCRQAERDIAVKKARLIKAHAERQLAEAAKTIADADADD